MYKMFIWTEHSSVFTSEIYQKATIFFFSSSFLGAFFGHLCLNAGIYSLDATQVNVMLPTFKIYQSDLHIAQLHY